VGTGRITTLQDTEISGGIFDRNCHDSIKGCHATGSALLLPLYLKIFAPEMVKEQCMLFNQTFCLKESPYFSHVVNNNIYHSYYTWLK
jgi:hypothetical protein